VPGVIFVEGLEAGRIPNVSHCSED
jgi:hypothetical protein